MSDDFSADTTTTGTISVGGNASGVLETGADHDWFKVYLTAGETYQFSVGSSNGGWTAADTPTLGVLIPTDMSQFGYVQYIPNLQLGPSDASSIWVRPDTSGLYYLSVEGTGGVGPYVVNATALAPDDYADSVTTSTATLAVGSSIEGQFEVQGDQDVFRVTLEAGRTYTLSASGSLANGAAPQVGFSTGSLAFENVWLTPSSDVGSSVNFTPTTSGTFYVTASAHDPLQGVGSYKVSLDLTADDYAANAAGAGALVIGGAATKGNIDVPQDVDWLKVSLQANQSYTLSFAADAAQAVFSIVNEQGTTLVASNAYGKTATQLSWVAPHAGDYYVQVQNYSEYAPLSSTGAYAVSVALTQQDDYRADRSTTGLLGTGQTLSGRIETATDEDWIKVKLVAGQAYLFDLSGATYQDGSVHAITDFNLVSDGPYPGAKSTSGSNNDKVISYSPSTSGDYFLVVNGWHASLSTYTVTSYAPVADDIAGDASTTGRMVEGGVMHGKIDAPNDHDWYKVEFSLNHPYRFSLHAFADQGGTLGSADGTAVIRLYDAKGTLVSSASGDFSKVPVVYFDSSFTSGTYYVDVSGSGFATGTYTLTESLDGNDPDITPPHAIGVQIPYGSDPLSADIHVIFDEGIRLGAGTITLRTAAGQLVEQFDAATSTHLTPAGNALIIDPSADLLPATDYVLEFGIGSIKDAAGNSNMVVEKETFRSENAPEHLTGGAGSDVLHAQGSGGTYDGGAGLDTLFVTRFSQDYVVTITSPTTTLWSQAGAETDVLTSIERVHFGNGRALAFDTGGSAGEVYRLYQAAFDRQPDLAGVGYWIAQADKGVSLHDIAGGFVGSAEFAALYGSAPTDSAFLTALYQNVLHRAPDAAGFAYWTDGLQHGVSRVDVLAAFSESAENQGGTAAAIHNGIAYIPY